MLFSVTKLHRQYTLAETQNESNLYREDQGSRFLRNGNVVKLLNCSDISNLMTHTHITYMHARTHTHTYTHTYIHTYIHTQYIQSVPSLCQYWRHTQILSEAKQSTPQVKTLPDKLFVLQKNHDLPSFRGPLRLITLSKGPPHIPIPSHILPIRPLHVNVFSHVGVELPSGPFSFRYFHQTLYLLSLS